MRAVAFRLNPEHHVLLVTLHHIAVDGWSLGVFLREFGTRSTTRASRRAAQLAPLPIRYSDYARWQRERMADGRLDQLTAHWAERLRGSPFVLELPTDRPRPTGRSAEGAASARARSHST